MSWIRPKTQVTIEVSGARFEAHGDPEVVQKTLEVFLSRVKPLAQPLAVARRPAAPMADEATPIDDTTTQVVRRRLKGRQLIRLHAIDGEIAKVYPIDDRRMRSGFLNRLTDLRNVSNIYVESPSFYRRVRGDQQTVWHAILPSGR